MEAATGALQPSSEYIFISLKYVKEKWDCISYILVHDHPVKMIICNSGVYIFLEIHKEKRVFPCYKYYCTGFLGL